MTRWSDLPISVSHETRLRKCLIGEPYAEDGAVYGGLHISPHPPLVTLRPAG